MKHYLSSLRVNADCDSEAEREKLCAGATRVFRRMWSEKCDPEGEVQPEEFLTADRVITTLTPIQLLRALHARPASENNAENLSKLLLQLMVLADSIEYASVCVVNLHYKRSAPKVNGRCARVPAGAISVEIDQHTPKCRVRTPRRLSP